MFLLDTNVIIDLRTDASPWRHWAEGAIGDAAEIGDLAINPIV